MLKKTTHHGDEMFIEEIRKYSRGGDENMEKNGRIII